MLHEFSLFPTSVPLCGPNTLVISSVGVVVGEVTMKLEIWSPGLEDNTEPGETVSLPRAPMEESYCIKVFMYFMQRKVSLINVTFYQ